MTKTSEWKYCELCNGIIIPPEGFNYSGEIKICHCVICPHCNKKFNPITPNTDDEDLEHVGTWTYEPNKK